MKGKTKSEKSARKLYLKAERLWKEYCFLRDGEECKVKRYFPHLNITHSNVYQVDHAISRRNKHLFFETSNGTVVCSSCNQAKGFKNKSVDRAIDQIVIDREGLERFNEMVRLDQSQTPNHEWGKVYWLETVVKGLEEKVEKLKPPILGQMVG